MKSIQIYPFAAIVGQEKMKLALILNVINPGLSGLLIRGEKGTAKSTAVRALADILPEIEVFENDPFHLSPGEEDDIYLKLATILNSMENKEIKLPSVLSRKVKVVELPLGATEDRVVGTMDLEHALKKGEKRVEPGLLAEAHRGLLYVDEVNLLDDHVVDVLLDSAAMGVNSIEREGISFSHPARFTLVGTMNPEEGELRPQLLDRFGLCVNIEGIASTDLRVQVMERRAAFDDNPEAFVAKWADESKKISEKIMRAKAIYSEVIAEKELLYEIARYCIEVGVDGHRGDIIMLKTARTIAAYEGRDKVTPEDVRTAAELALPHRVRRQPLMEITDNIHLVREKAANNK